MLKDTKAFPNTTGSLKSLDRGILAGELLVDATLLAHEALTVEVFAHGILAASARVPLTQAKPGEPLAFSFPMQRFPRVSLPCTLSARVVETDLALDSAVSLADLGDLWARVMPFSGRVEKVTHGQVEIRVTGHLVNPDDQVFELREGGDLVSLAEVHRVQPEGDTFYRIALPERLLDGGEHRLTVVHRGSGLPLNAEPLRLQLDLRNDPQPSPRELLDRIEGLEKQLRNRYAEAFNGLAAELYRHIDNVTLNQRSNFEREISALRVLLGMTPIEGPQQQPTEVLLPFGGVVTGYGIHGLEQTNSGKSYRFVAPLCGILMPGMARGGPVRLRIQGLRRSHPDALDGVSMMMNGETVTMTPYCNPISESWNITAELPERMIRQDYNMLELKLPNGAPDKGRDPATANISVGIHFASIQRAPPPAALKPGVKPEPAAAVGVAPSGTPGAYPIATPPAAAETAAPPDTADTAPTQDAASAVGGPEAMVPAAMTAAASEGTAGEPAQDE